MTATNQPVVAPEPRQPASWQVAVASVVLVLIGMLASKLGLSPEVTQQIKDGAAPLVSSVTGAPKVGE